MTGFIADIGGTNVRFALVGPGGVVSAIEPHKCADFPTLLDACEAYLVGKERPRCGAFAVASPVIGDVIQMTNHVWSFSVEETRRRLGLETLDVINDFIAVALGIPRLSGSDVARIGGGDPDPHAAIGVLGAGTGLGVAGLLRPRGGGYVPVSSEGGHVTLPAFDDREAAVIAELRREFGHVSAERVLSGPGIVNLYRAIGEVDGRAIDPKITPAECTGRAIRKECSVAMETLRMFCGMLGTVAANLALTLDARGGIFVAGGIVPTLGADFLADVFRGRFEAKGRFRGYLANIPTSIVTRPLPAFAGLAALVATG